jgi:hypothetical protein
MFFTKGSFMLFLLKRILLFEVAAIPSHQALQTGYLIHRNLCSPLIAISGSKK